MIHLEEVSVADSFCGGGGHGLRERHKYMGVGSIDRLLLGLINR